MSDSTVTINQNQNIIASNSQKNVFTVSLNELLQSDHFKDAQIIAGRSGINRMVKWVHIMEFNKNVQKWVNGYELLLSTGVGFTGQREEIISFMDQIIAKNVSGLCIALGSYFSEIPLEMLQIADEKQFPLIVVHEPIRFIDISCDLNTRIINKNIKMFSQVEDFLRPFNALLCSPHNLKDLLFFTYKELNVNIVYLPLEGNPVFFPNFCKREQKNLLDMLCDIEKSNKITKEINSSIGEVIYKQIMILKHRWGGLFFFSPNREITDFQALVIDKISENINQDLFREFYIEEKKSTEENKWVKGWLQGILKANKIEHYLKESDLPQKVSGYFTCVIDFSCKKSSINELIIHASIIIRPFFQEQGFSLIKFIENNQLICVILDQGKAETRMIRAKATVELIREALLKYAKNIKFTIGIGKMVIEIRDLNVSFNTAQEALVIQKKLRRNEPFYDYLHIYFVISKLDKEDELKHLIINYLEPVIQFDKYNNGELLQTLKVYYECNCSKQKAAEKIFIARQTMYLRLQKLEKLLGEDFMLPEKRLTIELAIYAYEYLNPK